MWYHISGALTFMVLAAALVTASFLMSPVIEDVFGEVNIQDNESFHLMKMKHFLVHRKMDHPGAYAANHTGNSSR